MYRRARIGDGTSPVKKLKGGGNTFGEMAGAVLNPAAREGGNGRRGGRCALEDIR